MLGNDEEIEDRVKELENKLEALLLEFEQNYEELDELRSEFEEGGEDFTEVQHGGAPFQVHWIKPNETDSFSDCSEIDDLDKAKLAFKEAAIKRDESSYYRPVHHGDVLFLLCDTAPDPGVDENGDPITAPACYYIGMCVKVDHTDQLEIDNTSKTLNLTESELSTTSQPYREFFAWDSCGAASAEPCDREEEYVTVVTASKVEVTSSGTNPKIHTIRGYEKTKELQFDECGTLVSVGTETSWTETGEEHEIKECCEEEDPCNPSLSFSSLDLLIVNDTTGLPEVDVTLSNDGTQCRYFDSTYNIQWSATQSKWVLSGGQFSGQNATEKGTYTGTAGYTITVS